MSGNPVHEAVDEACPGADACVDPLVEDACGVDPGDHGLEPTDIELELHLAMDTVSAQEHSYGGGTVGELVITNHRDEAVTVGGTSTTNAVLTDLATGSIVSRHATTILRPPLFEVAPGEQERTPVRMGTTSCGYDLGEELPQPVDPGTYGVVAGVLIDRTAHFSPPATVTVIGSG